MSRFLCIRHGDNDAVGQWLAARSAAVHLNDEGRRQVARVAESLLADPPDRIIASPLDRTRETAAILAERLACTVEIDEGLLEVAFGDWTGRGFDEMEQEPLWRRYHEFRSGIRIPGGEMAVEIQARMVAVTERLRKESPNARVALVSHGDPIRYLVAFYLGIPIDLALRLEIAPASVSEVEVADWGAKVHGVNRLP